MYSGRAGTLHPTGRLNRGDRVVGTVRDTGNLDKCGPGGVVFGTGGASGRRRPES